MIIIVYIILEDTLLLGRQRYMNSRRRTSDLIALQILKVCVDGASKTRIVYQTNLNSASAKPYIEHLIDKGFMEVIPVGSRVIYKTTPKGMELAKKFNQFHSEMDKLYACV
jgi:predicted transcriptional regulator